MNHTLPTASLLSNVPGLVKVTYLVRNLPQGVAYEAWVWRRQSVTPAGSNEARGLQNTFHLRTEKQLR